VILALTSILAAISSAQQDGDEKARLQQLKGRLEIRNVAKVPFMLRIYNAIAQKNPQALPFLKEAYLVESLSTSNAWRWRRSDGAVLRWLGDVAETPGVNIFHHREIATRGFWGHTVLEDAEIQERYMDPDALIAGWFSLFDHNNERKLEEDYGDLLAWIRVEVENHVRAYGDEILYNEGAHKSLDDVSYELLRLIAEERIASIDVFDEDLVEYRVDDLEDGDELDVVTFKDGAVITELMTAMALKVEGSRMHHCVGLDAYGHPTLLARGSVRIFSYRKPDGTPRATLEVGSDKSIGALDFSGPYNGRIADVDAKARMAWFYGKLRPDSAAPNSMNYNTAEKLHAEVERADSEVASIRSPVASKGAQTILW